MAVKQLQILKEVLPGLDRVGVLWNANNPAKVAQVKDLQEAAPSLGLRVLPIEVRRDADFTAAYQAIQTLRPDGLLVTQDPLMAANSAIAMMPGCRRSPSMIRGILHQICDHSSLAARFSIRCHCSSAWTSNNGLIIEVALPSSSQPRTMPAAIIPMTIRHKKSGSRDFD